MLEKWKGNCVHILIRVIFYLFFNFLRGLFLCICGVTNLHLGHVVVVYKIPCFLSLLNPLFCIVAFYYFVLAREMRITTNISTFLMGQARAQIGRDSPLISMVVVVVKHVVCGCIMGTSNSAVTLGFWMDLELPKPISNCKSWRLSFEVSLLLLWCNIWRKSKWKFSLSLNGQMVGPPSFVHYWT